ncbi:9636_t:CDS:2, partial [Cetraspora pellucida]
SSILENLNVLRNWPLDNNIKRIVHHAYKQATALARNILGMVLNTRVYDFITIPDDDENEIGEQYTELQRDDNLQTESIFISMAATEQSQNLNVEMDVNIGVVNGKLEFSVLINQHHNYEAYTNQRMERKVTGLFKSTPNNKFSSLISYLFSNETARPGVSHQNH